jgi:zinc transporter ZupT
LISVLSGLAPYKFKKLSQSQELLGIANTFSGGVFLAIAFVHIIPEAATKYYLIVLD